MWRNATSKDRNSRSVALADSITEGEQRAMMDSLRSATQNTMFEQWLDATITMKPALEPKQDRLHQQQVLHWLLSHACPAGLCFCCFCCCCCCYCCCICFVTCMSCKTLLLLLLCRCCCAILCPCIHLCRDHTVTLCIYFSKRDVVGEQSNEPNCEPLDWWMEEHINEWMNERSSFLALQSVSS